MERNQLLFEQIEAYLNKELTEEQHLAFQKRMEVDPILKEEVQNHKALKEAMVDMDSVDLRKKLQKIAFSDQEIDAAIVAPKKKRFPIWQIAASILLLLGITAFFWLNNTSSNNDLFETYYTVYPTEDTMRGEQLLDLNIALKSYENGNYSIAISQLKPFIEKYKEKTELKIFLGNCYLNTGNEKEAIGVFKKFKWEEKYYEDAQWYLALSHLKLNNKNSTCNALKKVIEYNGIRKKNAEALLNELKVKDPDYN